MSGVSVMVSRCGVRKGYVYVNGVKVAQFTSAGALKIKDEIYEGQTIT